MVQGDSSAAAAAGAGAAAEAAEEAEVDGGGGASVLTVPAVEGAGRTAPRGRRLRRSERHGVRRRRGRRRRRLGRRRWHRRRGHESSRQPRLVFVLGFTRSGAYQAAAHQEDWAQPTNAAESGRAVSWSRFSTTSPILSGRRRGAGIRGRPGAKIRLMYVCSDLILLE